MASSIMESPKITKYFSSNTNKVDLDQVDCSQLCVMPTKSEKCFNMESSVLLTPDSTPTKEHNTHPESEQKTKPSQTETSQCTCPSEEKSKTDSSQSQKEAEIVKPKKNRKRRNKKSANNKVDTHSETASPKPPPQSRQKKTEAPSNNTVLTDYFPVRRSGRRCLADIKKEEKKQLEEAILNKCADGLKVVQMDGKGRGVVSAKSFKRGDFVVEYEGDLIEVKTAKDREKRYETNPDLGCYMYYFNYNNKSYCVDATAESGRLGRLLNHSKRGNCVTRVVGVNSRPHLILVADRDIKIGEELLYDYGDRSKEALAAHPWLAY